MTRKTLGLVIVMLLVLGACGGGDGDAGDAAPTLDAGGSVDADPEETDPAAGEPQRSATISMTDDLSFEPSEVVIQVGGKVTWVNDSSMDHTSTAAKARAADAAHVELPRGADEWNSGFVKPGKSFTMSFDVPGTYRYFCIPHETVGMLGTIEVVE
ncbi:MAG: cupredoxin domain-containing protein [Actinomycetota bacterium]